MPSSKQIELDYFEWLSDLVEGFDGDVSYLILLKKLHNIDAFALLKEDENRLEDGKNLRNIYFEDNGVHVRFVDCLCGPCSVLELLIGLAMRMDDILYDPNEEDGVLARSFWEMIENAALDGLSDDEWGYHPNPDRLVKGFVNVLLNREYPRKGLLFPLKNRRKDCRKMELWYQMQEYLKENYGYLLDL